MTPEKETGTVQVNCAPGQRNAARDYFEFSVPGSLELFMATRSGEELDRVSVSNEHLFRHRFGFAANHAVRSQLIAFKQRYDITDDDMRNVCRSSQMAISHTEVKIKPDRFTPILGWVSLVVLSYYCFCLIWLIGQASTAPVWKMSLGIAIIVAIWMVCVWGLKSFYISPWRILKRAGALQEPVTGIS